MNTTIKRAAARPLLGSLAIVATLVLTAPTASAAPIGPGRKGPQATMVSPLAAAPLTNDDPRQVHPQVM